MKGCGVSEGVALGVRDGEAGGAPGAEGEQAPSLRAWRASLSVAGGRALYAPQACRPPGR
jgi:hypothetical protein